MVRGHEPHFMIGVKSTAQYGNGGIRLEEGLGRKLTQRADHTRLDRLKLLHQKGLARGNLIRFGVAILRGTTLQNIAYVHGIPGQPHSLYNVREELPRPAHKGAPLLVLISPGCLTHE